MYMHITGLYKLGVRRHTTRTLGGEIPHASGTVIKNACFLMLRWC